MTDPLLAPAEALGIPIRPEWEDGVLFHLPSRLLRIGGEVAAGLADDIDPLPLDRPPPPSPPTAP